MGSLLTPLLCMMRADDMAKKKWTLPQLSGRKKNRKSAGTRLPGGRRLYAVPITVAAAAVLSVVLSVSLRHYSSAELVKKSDYTAEDDARCVSLGGDIVQYGQNGATCMDINGSPIWSITFEMEQPIVDVSGDKIAIADHNGTDVYILDRRGKLGDARMDMPIVSVTTSKSGETAVVTSSSQKLSEIHLIGPDGAEDVLLQRMMNTSGYPIDTAVSPDGRVLCVSNLKMDNTNVKSEVSFYNFSSAKKKDSDKLVSSYDYSGEILPFVQFFGAAHCIGVSDSRMVVYDTRRSAPRSVSDRSFESEVQGVFSSDKYLGVLYLDSTGKKLYRLEIYNAAGRRRGEVNFTMEYTDLQICGNRVYIHNDHDLQIYSIHGREIYSGTLDKSITSLIPSESLGSLTAVTENEIDRVVLH